MKSTLAVAVALLPSVRRLPALGQGQGERCGGAADRNGRTGHSRGRGRRHESADHQDRVCWSTEGPIALPDGSVIFTETPANRITKIDKDNNVTTFLENTNGSNALAFDTKGRLITVQTIPGQTKVGVIVSQGQRGDARR